MARGDTYTCRTCGKTYNYCEKCAVTPVPYKSNGFCTKEHADIFSILSKHGCHLATAEETFAALGNIEGDFTPSIQAHIDAIKSEVQPVEKIDETPVVEEEFKTEYTKFHTKNNKKK
jgi:hypothetical protein